MVARDRLLPAHAAHPRLAFIGIEFGANVEIVLVRGQAGIGPGLDLPVVALERPDPLSCPPHAGEIARDG